MSDISRFILFIGPCSSIFDYTTFFIMLYVFGCWDPAQASLFQTGWFVESLLTQTLIIHVIRTNRIPFLQSRASWPLIVTTAVIMARRRLAALLAHRAGVRLHPVAAALLAPSCCDAARLRPADPGGEDLAGSPVWGELTCASGRACCPWAGHPGTSGVWCERGSSAFHGFSGQKSSPRSATEPAPNGTVP